MENTTKSEDILHELPKSGKDGIVHLLQQGERKALIRDARLDDVPAMRELINSYAELGRMLFRSLSHLYESLRDFKVWEAGGQVVGCCALQVLWADLAEIKSLAVKEGFQGKGIGKALVINQIEQARQLKVPRLFTLTLEPVFFEKLGFKQVEKDQLPMKVWSDCVRCCKQDKCDEIAMIYDITY